MAEATPATAPSASAGEAKREVMHMSLTAKKTDATSPPFVAIIKSCIGALEAKCNGKFLIHACAFDTATVLEAKDGGAWARIQRMLKRGRTKLDFAAGLYLSDTTHIDDQLGSLWWAANRCAQHDPKGRTSLMFYRIAGWAAVQQLSQSVVFNGETAYWRGAVASSYSIEGTLVDTHSVEGPLACKKDGNTASAGWTIDGHIVITPQYCVCSETACTTLDPYLYARMDITWK